MNDIKLALQKNYLVASDWIWKKDPADKGKVHQWIQPMEDWEGGNPDVVLFGMPLSRSSISVSGASEYPSAFRRSWKGFSTYNLDEDIDLSSLSVVDLGDVKLHGTNVEECHQRIEQAAHAAAKHFKKSITVGIGGDHSVTACSIRGLRDVYPDETIGILQLDTHLDLRDPAENGPTNGTPIRQLIEGGIVKGEHVCNIGLHGFFNTADLVAYGKEQGINMITLQRARRQGITNTIEASLQQLTEKVDRIYVTVDMDVLDISFAPGVPASTPGGMTTQELFDALLQIGRHKSFRHIDFVCLDPTKDEAASPTVKAGVYSFLQVMTGAALAKREGEAG
ncbi:formimidoylglutamase [Jeotgalibacillus sp. S-D1]|uniref:agmatinase family protein n=1 Tax=Jeotgalibacillus sp. S-D1 TaxID=2552189 RepID=UPI0010597A1F|nr:agmatinase family protein [Jeotgalibacillus sp. S-D1]TDL31721.1 formimidoylglutamase [Jeotgalibacillus sp. S-D1]